MQWFRLYHGTMTDPKFGSVARKTGQTRERVVFVWLAILESASEADERGAITTDIEAIADTLNCDEEAISAIWQQFVERGMIGDGRVTKWNERNPLRDDSAARQRAKRERDADVTRTPRDSDAHVTRLDTDTELDIEREVIPPSPSGDAPPKAKSSRGSRLPSDWQPSPEDAAFASEHGVDVETEAAKFRDYWQAKTGKDASKLDWSATWRNWCRRAGEDAKRKPDRKHDPTIPARRHEPTEAEWRTAVRKWKAGGPWPMYLGPRPDMVSTRVPKHIREEAA